MNRNTRNVIYTNSSIIAMLQRIADITIILLTTYIVASLIEGSISNNHFLIAFITISIFQLICGMTDFYRSWRGIKFNTEIKLLLRNWLLSVVFSFFFLSFTPSINADINYYSYWFFVSIPSFIILRLGIRFFVKYLRQLGYNNRKLVIVGGSKAGVHFIDNILRAPWLGFSVTGYYMVNNESSSRYDDLKINKKGGVDELIRDAKAGEIDRVYIALSTEETVIINHIFSELADTTCTAFFIPDIATYNVLQSRSEIINGIPVISLYDSPMSGINMIIKRIEDVILSSLILLLISPVLLLIAISIKITSPGPILFKQKRYGMDGKEISVWKFRSMTVMEDGSSVIQAIKNDPRVTLIGSFLRKTSLDELPQFFNVIYGDMSIVGPRPHAIVHNEQYRKLIKGYMLRHKMKPGITGWAQINGWRGETDTLEKMEKRVEYDLFYIQNWTFWLDLKIIILTIFKGFVNKSAY